MASNAASSVQFCVNGTEMARGRTRKTERSQSMDPRAKPRAARRLEGNRRDNRDERELILGPENAGNFCIARRSRGISAIVSRRLSQKRTSGAFQQTLRTVHGMRLLVVYVSSQRAVRQITAPHLAFGDYEFRYSNKIRPISVRPVFG